MKHSFFLLAFYLLTLQSQAQIIYGSNNYTQYHPGSLPIVISVPHGGLVAPASIPNRTCNNPTTVTDSRTIELARQIDTALFNLTGCRPHLVICNLRRTKVDCNRNIEDGACGNSEAEQAWTEFQAFIDTAQLLAQSQFSGKAFYIDLHGHGKMPYRLELGYGLSGSAYNNTDSILNTASYLANSSIQNLVNTNTSGSTHAALLRGDHALGTLLVEAGYPAVPSQQFPNTGGFPYFNGGYNTANHTCLAPGNTVNGLQIECDSIVRSGYLHRKAFGDSLAAKLLAYLSFHQNIDLSNCSGCTPSLSAIGSTSLCPGDSVSLSATDFCNGCTVNWSNGMTGPNITVQAAGNYTATVLNPANPDACLTSPASNVLTVTAVAAPAAATVIAGGPTLLCPGQSVSLTATGVCEGCTVNWSNGASGASITVFDAGVYSAYLVDTCGTVGPASPPVEVVATAFAPTITVGSPCHLAAPSGGSNYQWYLDGVPLPGAVTPSLVAEATGLYAVSMTNEVGCSGISEALFVEACASVTVEPGNRLDLAVIPNPASSAVHFQFSIQHPTQLQLELLTVNGQVVKTAFDGIAKMGEHSIKLDLADLVPGIYLYRFRSEEVVRIGRVLVVR
jgi:hypothetical protein